jgi:hypothetical protein
VLSLSHTKCTATLIWLRCLVVALAMQGLVFDGRSFVVDKMTIGQFFFSDFYGFPKLVSFHHCVILIFHSSVTDAI